MSLSDRIPWILDGQRVLMPFIPTIGQVLETADCKLKTIRQCHWSQPLGAWKVITDGDDGQSETQDHSEGRRRSAGDNVQAVRQPDVGTVHKTRTRRNRKKTGMQKS